MSNNIEKNLNDFILVSSMLRNFSRHFKCPFLDFSIEFKDIEMARIDGESLFLPENSSPHAMSASAVTVYLQNLLKLGIINEQEFRLGLNFNLGLLYEVYDKKENVGSTDVLNIMKMDQFPHAFIPLCDLILPELNIPYDNYRVVISPDLKFDVCSSYFDSNGLTSGVCDSDDFPIIFLNSHVRNPVFYTPFLINCYLSCCFKNKKKSIDSMRLLLSNLDLIDILNSFYGSIWEEEDLSRFFFVLGILFDLPYSTSDVLKSHSYRREKTAQARGAANPSGSSFWHFGLIEKMLGPVRGYDFTIKEVWQPIVDKLLMDIEEKRKKSNLSGSPLEFMLRVKDDDMNCEKPTLLQDMLSETRVW